MSRAELRRQHCGSLATCDRLKRGREYMLKMGKATTKQICRDLGVASARDMIRSLRANGMNILTTYEGKSRSGAMVYAFTVIR